MRVGEAEIRHLAALAKLELSADELPELASKLEAILGYVAALEDVARAGEQDCAAAPDSRETPLRPDAEPRALPLAEVVRSAPRSEAGALVVPRIVE
jgi:aspartyl-tRNA(Asn)/glutamyl-tRNA(Gln) amidotransferase subunit C